MNSEFELIRYNRRLPARIEIKEGAIETPYHWHKEIELVYVLESIRWRITACPLKM